MNEILFRRRLKVDIVKNNVDYSENERKEIYKYILPIVKNIESFGFTFSNDVIKILETFTKDQLLSFYKEIIDYLRKLTSSDINYHPMYPNFPKQVAEMSDVELFINAIAHYWTLGNWTPDYEKNSRMPLIDNPQLKIISLGNKDEVYDIFSNLLNSKTSLSEQDKRDMETIIKYSPKYINYLPKEIPLKENVALLTKVVFSLNSDSDLIYIMNYFKTATDVLRFIVALSNGDISLAEKCNFKHLSRPERRFIMKLLSNCGEILEDLYRYKNEWIRLGEIIHPGEFKRYDKVVEAFNTLRNLHKPLFLMGQIEEAIKNGQTIFAAQLLIKRPGDFARKLDKLLRDSSIQDKQEILEKFESIAEKVSTPVLLQLRQVFIARSLEEEPVARVFFPKGNVAKVTSIPYELKSIEKNICTKVIQICENALLNAYKTRDSLGSVYIDPSLKEVIVPFSQRSASEGNKILTRGSRIAIKENTKAIRGFIWWTNTENQRVDIDLSACILDENLNYKSHISYTRLRDEALLAYHSGDITNGGPNKGKGVAEFLDTDIEAVVKNGGRYICYQVYSYTRQPFATLPNCRFGWMEREDVNSGEIFEPKTVETAIKLTSNSTITIPVLFDCIERKFIWLDVTAEIAKLSRLPNNLENNFSGVRAVLYAFVNLNKPNLYDLIYLNAYARGKIVWDKEKADIIFALEKEESEKTVITAFDIDYFMGNML